MPVMCAKGDRIGTVDRIEGNLIKLTKDDQGRHHWIPVDWLRSVDHQVHLDRAGDRVKREWMTEPPGMGGEQAAIPL